MPERNYSDTGRPNARAGAERVGDLTGQTASNKTVERNKATTLANLLEGVDFPATKEEIIQHINTRSPGMGRKINDILETVNDKLDERARYENTYEVELAAGLVEQKGSEKPYVRDKALNRANNERIGERIRPDPYPAREKIRPASAKDVSPNTPPGEDV